jgi:drug/metabolite transporter (DMT)-like permease
MIFVLLAFVVLFLVVGAQFVKAAFAYRGELRGVSLTAVSMVSNAIPIVAFLAAAYSIYRRLSWSRWLGVAAILGLAAFSLLGPDTTQYANDAERAGGHLARILLMPLLLAWWAYAFGFSSKAKRYFSRGPSNTA